MSILFLLLVSFFIFYFGAGIGTYLGSDCKFSFTSLFFFIFALTGITLFATVVANVQIMQESKHKIRTIICTIKISFIHFNIFTHKVGSVYLTRKAHSLNYNTQLQDRYNLKDDMGILCAG